MMAITLSETEDEPIAWPTVASDSLMVQAANSRAIWRRIEAWIAWRWSARSVVWRVEGPGHWEPRLSPAVVTATDLWNGDAWEPSTLRPGPLGYEFGHGFYRIAGTVGTDDPPPAAVEEAYRRLADYSEGLGSRVAGASSENRSIGELTKSYTRRPDWLAMAMVNSGAADLLRPYRRAS